jgi:hypothetical protein
MSKAAGCPAAFPFTTSSFVNPAMRTALAAALWFLTATTQAQTPSPAAELAGSAGWLKLGHYERSSFGTGWQSTIHAGEFFLAQSGDKDPRAELDATITALNAGPGADPEQHAQCRFPARLQWLRQQSAAHLSFRTDIRCPRFEEWTQSGGIASVSVVLATGFLGNPASYYGHTLLKFNFRDGEGHTSLLDESASYGAIMDGRKDNPVKYIIKSLAHQYDAGFSHIRFYYHDHNYGNHELRDLWEYRLDLSAADRDMVVAHTWEVLGKRYTYEFFQGNCALRMAEVIEILDGVQIAPQRPWIIPQALVQRLASARYEGRPLVADVIYHPSRQSRFYDKYQALSRIERKAVHALVTRQEDLQGPQFRALPTPSQQAVIDTLLDYHQFANNPIAEASQKDKDSYAAALAMRYELPAGEPQSTPRQPESPGGARAPGWLQASWKHNSGTGDILSLRLRGAFYDPLDYDIGHVRFGSLVMGDIQLDVLNGHLRIGRLDVARIESVNPAISGLPGDSGAAWKLAIGADQARLFCEDCLAAHVQGDIGRSRLLAKGLWAGAFAGGSLQTHAANQGPGFGRLSAAMIMELGAATRARVGYEIRLPVDAESGSYSVAHAELRWAFGKHGDLRIRYDHDRVDEIGAGFGFYW